LVVCLVLTVAAALVGMFTHVAAIFQVAAAYAAGMMRAAEP
jgi:hypothetical protein